MMKRCMTMAFYVSLVMVPACTLTLPNGGGGNDNMNSNGGGGGGGEGLDNSNTNTDSGDGSEPNTNGGNSNSNSPDDSDQLPVAFRLDGNWLDGEREVEITQSGTEVVAFFVLEYLCDRDRGSVHVDQQPAEDADLESTFLDFSGALNHDEEVMAGDVIEGQTSVCRFGHDDEESNSNDDNDNESGGGLSDGFNLASLTITVSDANTLEGFWMTEDGSGFFTVTRLPCPLTYPDNFGLPDPNKRTQFFVDNIVERADGSVEVVPDDYIYNFETDNSILYNTGVDYTSINENGEQVSLPFTAGVTGTVRIAGAGSWNSIFVDLEDGSTLEYMGASQVLVEEGQPVFPDTVLGLTGNRSPIPETDVYLHIQAYKTGVASDPTNLDCIVDGTPL